MEQTKKCSKCGEVKGLEAFGKHKGRKDGIDTRCKQCNCAAVRAYTLANLETVRARKREYEAARPKEVKREAMRSWKAANKEYVLSKEKVRKRAAYAADPHRYRSMSKAWADVNKNKIRARMTADVTDLRDPYVKAALRNLGVSEQQQTPELIALKREQLAIKRMARELKKAATKPTGEPE